MLTCRGAAKQLNIIKQLKDSFDKKIESAFLSNDAGDDVEKSAAELKEAIRILEVKLAADEKDFYINPETAERFNLKRVELKGNPEAQSLIDQVCDRKIDITTNEGQNYFIEQWLEKVRLPLPCQVKDVNSRFSNSFAYLKILYQGSAKSLTDINSGNEAAGSFRVPRPDYGSDRTLYIDNWEENDWGARQDNYTFENLALKNNDISVILNKLGFEDGVVGHSRLAIDTALWVGDPAERNPTEKHKKILQDLGIFEDDVYIRLISYQEYLACVQNESLENLGKKELLTMLDDRDLAEDYATARSLMAGYHSLGGAACCLYLDRTTNYPKCAIRLVISKN